MVKAAVAGSTAGSVVLVLMAVVVAVLGVYADSNDACPGSSWFESDETGRWLMSVKVDTGSQHPPAVIRLPWTAFKEDSHNLIAELGVGLPQDGPPLPMLTCHAPPARCRDFSSPTAPCTRTVRRAVCVAVNRGCQALVVTVNEPTECCCGLKGRNSTLTGKVTNMWLIKTCSPLCDDTTQGEGRTKKGGRGGESILSSEGNATLSSFQETVPNVEDLEALDNTTSDGKNQRAEAAGGVTEEHVKKSSVLEDAIAALVFLFVGAVLVLIKSRLFRFTKKKQQQEDKDVESEVTLVDETIMDP